MRPDELGRGGIKEKFRANVEAVHLIRQLEAEARPATAEEQAALARFVGWGGMPQAFEDATGKWGREVGELRKALTPAEWRMARNSTRNAHYTSAEVIGGMWDGLIAAGFRGGAVFEPGMGVGNFFGLMPAAVRTTTRLHGIELDDLTGRIARQLYPKADIRIGGFQATKWPADHFDLIIGNVPFGAGAITDIADRSLSNLKAPIHDFMIAKSLRLLRPGGIAALITSRFSLDKMTSKVRKDWARHADLLGAVRLPFDAFKANANTEVVTDILFFRRRGPREPAAGQPFIDSRPMTVGDQKVSVNEYYHAHPENVLGTPAMTGTMRGPDQFNVEPAPGPALGERIREAMRRMPIVAGDLNPVERQTREAVERSIAGPVVGDAAEKRFGHLREGNLAVDEGRRLVWRIGDKIVAVKTSAAALTKARLDRIAGMIAIRDAGRELIGLEQDPAASDAAIVTARRKLNRIYDAFVEKHKPLSTNYNKNLFSDDSDAGFLLSLERYDQETTTAAKADLFAQRTNFPVKPVTAVETPQEALAASLDLHGRVDPTYMARLLNRTEADLVRQEDGRAIFEDPDAGWASADQYLSGNVREKLARAREMAAVEPIRYRRYVEQLEKVQPADIPPGKIGVKLGSGWVPTDVYEQFISEVFGGRAGVRYAAGTGTWVLDAPAQLWDRTEYGTTRLNALEILEKTLNHRPIKITDKTRDGDTLVNFQATEQAQAQQAKMISRFRHWLWQDARRGERLVRIYNDTMNNIRVFRPRGDHLTFPGMNVALTAEMTGGQRRYRMDAVWRVVSQGNSLIAHAVGGGKTITAAAAIMEMRRLGRWKKPVVVVPNHLIEQWPREFMFAYPGARLLVAQRSDFSPKKRQVLFHRIVTGDYDAVIVPASSFGKMPMSPEVVRAFYERQIDDLEKEIRSERAAKSNRNFVKELEKSLDGLRENLNRQSAAQHKDKGPYFDELGIDALVVDESQMFKNLWFKTKMGRVPGISPKITQRSFDMHMKTDYLNGVTNERGVVFLTGTPITNSVVEMFTLQRYLQPKMLEKRGLVAFDSWASTFGDTVTDAEVDVTGEGVRIHTRFRQFDNLPELKQMYRTVADIQTPEDMGLSLPKVAGGEPKTIVAERGEELSGIIESLVARMRVIRSGGMDPTTDNALSVTNDGRDAAIDLRLYDPKMPDLPTSKLNLAIENVARIAEVTAQERKTQVIWLDRGVPGSNTIDLYEDIRRKLVARGIEKAQIAFIHDAGDSAAKRQDIFDRVNSGEVRILIGSTEKMGVGANIQARLTAAHHLDAPWRPADVMQRDGRILRFRNMNDTVQIFRYVTKGSFDAYNWQTLDNKAGFLNQLATDDMTVREIEDVAKTALSYAEVTALAAQDPRIMDLVRLGEQVRKLRAAEQAHQTTEFQRRQQLRAIPRDRERLQRGIVEAEKAIRAIDKLAAADPDELPLVVAGERFAKHKDAGEALGSEIKRVFAADEGDPGPIGDLYGFPIKPRKLVFYEDGKPKDVAALRIDFGNGHTVEVVLGEDAVGNVARVLHVVERMKAGLTENRELLANLDREAARIRKIVGEPFAKEAELQEQEAELAALKAELTGQKAQPLPPIDRAAIVETFPGSLVTAVSEAGTGYRVELPGGRWLEVVVETDIDVDWPAAEAAAGRRIPLAERAKLAAAGAFTLRTRDGTTHGGLGLIRLANGLADAGTLRHEAIHLAREAGLFLDAEWQSLVDAYSDQSRSAQRQEEDIATAAETWGGKQGLAQKIKAWINTLLNVAGISRIDHRTVEFMVGQRAFWGRPAAPKAGQIQSVRHQLRRRPPLANPAAEAVARDLVRETDALMASIGEPPPRPRMVAREQARVAVRADAMGQHDRLLAVGEAGQSYESEADNDAAQLIIDQLGIKAFSSNNEADRQRAVRFVMAYRRARTETARLLGAGTQQALPGETPTQQRARNLREDILTPPEFYERKYKGEKEIAAAWTRQIEKIRVQLKAIGIDLDHLEDYVRDAVTFARVKKMIEPAKASRWDKAYEIWLNSILSSVTTAKVNLYGNLGHAAWALTAERLVEIGVNAVFRNPSEAQVGELKYLLAGILPGLSRGAANALKSWETETPWFETSLGIGVDAKNSAYQRIETPRVAIGGALGRGVRALGFRHLLAADEFSKSLIAQMEAGAQAYRMARAEGLRGEEMKLRIAELMADLKSDAWVKAHDLAVELAFQRKLGPFGRSILKFREGAPGARYIIPFVVTPGNIFKTGIKKSPLGTVKLAEQVYRGFRRGDWSGIQPMIAQQLIAWTGMLALMGYIDDEEGNPNITGATAEYSYRTRVTAQRTYPTQSIRIGGKWWSYSRLEPFATTLGLTVDWLRALRRPQSHHAANEAIQSLIGQLHNKTFLRGVADFMDAIDSETPAQGMAKWASSFTTSWIPRLVQVPLREASADYVDRKFWGDGPDWWLRLWRRTVQKSELGIIPDQPAYDLWGRTAPRPGAPWAHGPRTDYLWRILEPFAVRTDRPMSAGDRAIVNWNNANPGQPYNPLPPAPYYKGTNGDRVGMTDEQKSDYYRLAGRVAAQLVELEISDPSDPTENDMDTIRGALAESRRAVKALLVKAWSGGTDAGEAINGLAAKIYERQVAHQAEKLSRPVPLKWSMREKFHEDVASARQWLADRDISRRELRRIYLRRLRREMKDPTARLRRANRAARRLEPAA